jgi:hypothetical protein
MKTSRSLVAAILLLLPALSAQAGSASEPYYFTTAATFPVGGNGGPMDVASDSAGNLYVAEISAGRISKIAPDGTVSTFVSGFKQPNPWGVAVDIADNVYATVDDKVLKISPSGAVATLASGLGAPAGIAVDTSGRVYRTDIDAHKVFKVTPDGFVSTIASGFSLGPIGIAVDPGGSVYVGSDSAIWRINSDGTRTVFAGAPGQPGSNDGVGTDARFNFNRQMASDKYGNLIVAESENSCIRKITPAGVVTTLGGDSNLTGTTDGVGSHALFTNPWGAGVDSSGRVIVADDWDGRVRIGVPASRALNISTRMDVQSGNNVLIGGFIVSGSAPKKVMLRALGPSLSKAGVANTLADPVLELHAGDGSLVASNDNWKDKQQTEIEATGIPPADEHESALMISLNPGNYTAILSGKNNGTGVGLVEAYDLDQNTSYRLANISTRGLVETGTNVMIGGFIVGGGPGSSDVLVRGLGPSLSATGISNALTDPTLELHDGNGSGVASNDNWKDAQQKVIEATGIPPTNDAESAVVATLLPGNYTAVLAGKNGGSGIGLVEVYHLQ